MGDNLSMSENLDLVRSIYADWERGDFGSVEWADPEIDFVSTDGPAPGVSTGVAGMTKAWRDMLVAWDNLRVEVDEYRDSTTAAYSYSSASARAARPAEWTSDRCKRR